MSFRVAARSALRLGPRAPPASARLAMQALRPKRVSCIAPAFRAPGRVSAFSTAVLPRSPGGDADKELAMKLASEMEFEQEVEQNEPMPASVKDFLDNGPFAIEDASGKDEVLLRRTFGKENITVSFSIADLQNMEPDVYNEDDPAMSDEDGGETGRSTEQDGEDGGEDDMKNDTPVPVRLNIVVEKPGMGALNIEASAQEGNIVVENFYYYADAKLANRECAEDVHKSQDVYPGPPFGSLDEDLQVLMERYLEDRGIAQALAHFVPEYMEMKEQKEYLTWLRQVKDFVEA